MPGPTAPRFAGRFEDIPPPGEFAAHSGMEIMQSVPTGRLPPPPICRRLECRLAEVGDSRAVFEGEPGFGHYRALSDIIGHYRAL